MDIFLSILPFFSVLITIILGIVLGKHLAKGEFGCPSCNNLFSRKQKRKFIRMFGFRQALPCPRCGTTLLLAKSSHILTNIGMGFFTGFVLLMLVTRLLDRNISDLYFWILMLMGNMGVLLGIVGQYILKFEQVDSKKIPDTSDNETVGKGIKG